MNECVSSEEDCHDKDAVIRLDSPCSNTLLLHGGVAERVHVCKIVCHDPFMFNHCNFLPFSVCICISAFVSLCIALHLFAVFLPFVSFLLYNRRAISTCSSHVSSFPTSYPFLSFDTHFIFFVTVFQHFSLTSRTLSPLRTSSATLTPVAKCVLVLFT